MELQTFDWVIIIFYLMGMIGLSIYLSRGQKSKGDYYLGGNNTGAWPIAISTMATQCSTSSILGAPAFVAFTVGGGMLWLQYELAVPFAMIFLMIFLLPLYRRLGIISVYAYLEKRFDKNVRVILSILFQFVRAFGTGVTVYGISIVISYCTGLSFAFSVIMLGVITVIYDSIGGMKAVIMSDVIQMIILYGSIVMTIFFAINLTGGWDEMQMAMSPERMRAISFDSAGFDGNSFTFWPMLLGGLFLYISYYGCDQSQVQRELSTKSVDDTNYALFLNGILRFPLVLTYCFLGLCIAGYVTKHPEFIGLLPVDENGPNYNMAVPIFVIKYFPTGAVGLVMVGLFSAAMSSLDSVINSLSATTLQDVFRSYLGKEYSEKQEFFLSKILTIFWGTVCTIFAFFVGDISSSIIVSINKIGSLANGPILGVFLLGILTSRATGPGAIVGLIAGFIVNTLCWVEFTFISWPWWNLIGCVVCFAIGMLVSLMGEAPDEAHIDGLTHKSVGKYGKEMFKKNWTPYYYALVGYGVLIFVIAYSL